MDKKDLMILEMAIAEAIGEAINSNYSLIQKGDIVVRSCDANDMASAAMSVFSTLVSRQQ